MTSYLAERRKELGKTQKEIAEYIGVTEATVSRWESGDIANMRRDKIKKYSEILHVSPSAIMGWDDAIVSKEDNLGTTSDQSEVEDSFTYAAHKYSGQLREEDKNTIIKMMQTLAAANEGSANGRTD